MYLYGKKSFMNAYNNVKVPVFGILSFIFIFVIIKDNTKEKIQGHYYNDTRILDWPQILKEPYSDNNINEVKDRNIMYSQAQQDKLVYELFPTEDGKFVEMGAYGGNQLSNTLWLERRHNWTGLLIEANPDLCQKIDSVRRRAWRLCACISSSQYAIFLKFSALGGVKDNIDKHHMKWISAPQTDVTVPCFKLDQVLEKIKMQHVTYFSLDVEGAELAILKTIEKELMSGKITVDVWTIEYRVYDGKEIVFDASLKKLQALRSFFKDIGNYVEHSQLSDAQLPKEIDGWALDVVFVNRKTWCRKYKTLPNDMPC